MSSHLQCCQSKVFKNLKRNQSEFCKIANDFTKYFKKISEIIYFQILNKILMVDKYLFRIFL